ncbi:unnamed protein product, partial [Closterium sp. NIES-54]
PARALLVPWRVAQALPAPCPRPYALPMPCLRPYTLPMPCPHSARVLARSAALPRPCLRPPCALQRPVALPAPCPDPTVQGRGALSVLQSRDAAACIALSSLLPESEAAYFTQVCTASDLLTTIKARYSTPSFASLGRLLLPFLFPDLASFGRAAGLIAHLPSVRDTLLLKHPSELTINVLESALKDVESNLRSVASASGSVPPPLFQGCTVPQLPTFTASLASTATDKTAAVATTGARSRSRGGKKRGKGAGSGGGSGGSGGGEHSSSGGCGGVGDEPSAPTSGPSAASGGGDARGGQGRVGPCAGGA